MENVFIMDHPLIQHKISMLRNKNTGTNEFRKLIEEIAVLMGYEALCSFAPVTESALNSFIDVAVQNQQEEILSFLMNLKKDRFGFHDREFTL